MVGKPSIPPSVLARIKTLAAEGMSQKAIATIVGVSRKTVLKTIDPDFAERERERQRRVDAARAAKRRSDPAYHEYQQAYGATEKRRAQVRERMAALRAARKAAAAEV